nr:hypothetical protein GCM10025732_15160 [Glycomyces mayteni]
MKKPVPLEDRLVQGRPVGAAVPPVHRTLSRHHRLGAPFPGEARLPSQAPDPALLACEDARNGPIGDTPVKARAATAQW